MKLLKLARSAHPSGESNIFMERDKVLRKRKDNRILKLLCCRNDRTTSTRWAAQYIYAMKRYVGTCEGLVLRPAGMHEKDRPVQHTASGHGDKPLLKTHETLSANLRPLSQNN
jgi:hypothetical protein